jgi:hypothetical protein
MTGNEAPERSTQGGTARTPSGENPTMPGLTCRLIPRHEGRS